jgi:cellulose biosynthesis protein BcsQ
LDNLSRIEDLHKRLQNPTNVKINNLFIKKVNRNNNINTSYIIDIAEKFKIENIFVNIELLDSNTDLLTKVYP